MCQGFDHFSGLLHHFVLANLATRSIRVKCPPVLSGHILLIRPMVFFSRFEYHYVSLFCIQGSEHFFSPLFNIIIAYGCSFNRYTYRMLLVLLSII